MPEMRRCHPEWRPRTILNRLTRRRSASHAVCDLTLLRKGGCEQGMGRSYAASVKGVSGVWELYEVQSAGTTRPGRVGANGRNLRT